MSKPRVWGSHPHEYLKSTTEIEILSPCGTFVAGYAMRCGITPPGYPDRATYLYGGVVYVYDGGELHPVNEWKFRHWTFVTPSPSAA